MKSIILVVSLAAIAGAATDFRCPKPNGQFEDPIQCDKYFECVDGVAEEKLCPDGLVFDPLNRGKSKCDHPYNTDCGDRTELQLAQPIGNCERRNGIFAHPNPATCHIFYTCVDGTEQETSCPAGLVFDENTATCAWPAIAGRSGCVRSEKLADGFECPKEEEDDTTGPKEAHPRYPHDDCQKFYICLNGVTPREGACDLGLVFNPDTKQCESPENVAGCEDWYKDHPILGGEKKTGDRTVIRQ